MNKRIHERLGVEILVEVMSQEGKTRARTANVSRGGLALKDAPEYAKGARLDLILDLDGVGVQVKGIVVWTGVIGGVGPRCGIAFDGFVDNGRESLDEFLDRRL